MGTYPAGDLTKKKLYEVAKEIFYEKGYIDATLKEICLKANVKQSVFFYHYKDKSEIAKLIYSNFGEAHTAMINDEIRQNAYSTDLIICTCVFSAVFYFNTLENPHLNRFWAEMYLNNMPADIPFFRHRYKNMFNKRKLDDKSIEFDFFLISCTSIDGVLLQKYYQKNISATPDQIVRFKLSHILWGLKYEQKEIDEMIHIIIDIAKKITVRAGKNFEIYYKGKDEF